MSVKPHHVKRPAGFLLLPLVALLALAGCQGLQRSPAPLPTVVLDSRNSATPQATSQGRGGIATASGVVVPAQEVQMAFGLGENVKAVRVAVGDTVQAGQVLIELDDEALQAQYAQAKAALDAAQARLDAITAGPRREQVAQAEANLASAQAALEQLRKGPTEEEIALARLAIDQARSSLWGAQNVRDDICGNKALPGDQCSGAEAQVAVAATGVQQAETRLAQLQAGATPETITQAENAVRAAQAQLDLAKAPYTSYDLAAAQAQVKAAQAQKQAAEAQLKKLVLRAPFAGTVSKLTVHGGEWVTPGQPVLVLSDLNTLRVETTDLSELDVPRVEIGQPATVTIKALNQSASGRVNTISPLPSTLGGDVVYKATVELDERPAGLRSGMSVEVQFGR